MSFVQSFAYLRGNSDGVINLVEGELFSECSPLDIFHDDEQRAIDIFDTMDGADVWMVQCRRGLRFLEKAFFGRSVVVDPVGEEF